MMKSSFKYVLATLLVASWVVAIVEWMALTRAREETRALAAQIQSGGPQSSRELPTRQAEEDELSKLRRENQELYRLRNEVTQLRDQKKELDRLQAENQQLRDTINSEREKIEAQWTAWVAALRTNGMKPEDVFP